MAEGETGLGRDGQGAGHGEDPYCFHLTYWGLGVVGIAWSATDSLRG
jgi:hypothetical protein